MTFYELNKLSMNGTHKTIGNVQFYLDNQTRKLTRIQVNYKSGKTFTYRKKEDLPKTVRDFLSHQNYHYSIYFSATKTTWCYYFMN